MGQRLDAIIEEFRRNGLEDTGDVRTLGKVRSILGRLSEREMAEVIASLQAARSEAPGAALHDAAAAHAGQKSIITQLDAIIREYQRKQALADLAGRFGRWPSGRG